MKSEWNVGRLLDVSSAYWRGCTIQAAVRLKIFSWIGDTACSAEQIAEAAASSTEATRMLLNALASLNLLVKEGDSYTNTSFSRSYLTIGSESYMGHIILHHHHLVDGWAQLDRAVLTGGPIEKRSYGEQVERESFLMGMFNLAMGLAPEIAGRVDFSERKKLLDLGGGPGTYAIHFCLANPDLQAVVFDRPTTRPFAEQTIRSFGLEKRISFREGDFTTDELAGGPFDAAWLSHILHSNSLESCQVIIRKTVDQLSDGGVILIHDFILEDTMDAPEFAALFSLNMLINNAKGRSYSEREIRTLLTNAGITKISRDKFRSPNGSSIMMGVV